MKRLLCLLGRHGSPERVVYVDERLGRAYRTEVVVVQCSRCGKQRKS